MAGGAMGDVVREIRESYGYGSASFRRVLAQLVPFPERRGLGRGSTPTSTRPIASWWTTTGSSRPGKACIWTASFNEMTCFAELSSGKFSGYVKILRQNSTVYIWFGLIFA
jgi:hypothetical protein